MLSPEPNLSPLFPSASIILPSTSISSFQASSCVIISSSSSFTTFWPCGLLPLLSSLSTSLSTSVCPFWLSSSFWLKSKSLSSSSIPKLSSSSHPPPSSSSLTYSSSYSSWGTVAASIKRDNPFITKPAPKPDLPEVCCCWSTCSSSSSSEARRAALKFSAALPNTPPPPELAVLSVLVCKLDAVSLPLFSLFDVCCVAAEIWGGLFSS